MMMRNKHFNVCEKHKPKDPQRRLCDYMGFCEIHNPKDSQKRLCDYWSVSETHSEQ